MEYLDGIIDGMDGESMSPNEVKFLMIVSSLIKKIRELEERLDSHDEPSIATAVAMQATANHYRR